MSYLVSGHLSLVASGGNNKHGVAGQLAAQGDTVPILATILGVQQDGRLAHDPALLSCKADALEAVVEALVLSCCHLARVPGPAAIVSLKQRLPAAEQESCRCDMPQQMVSWHASEQTRLPGSLARNATIIKIIKIKR